ncbi:hypothetical protein SXCC_02039 [Gluconacetobacter sp. SXCC-1]|nr:hypothetical protein SXCC_02039 [Gluconacetobacter sp. SXCC-1]
MLRIDYSHRHPVAPAPHAMQINPGCIFTPALDLKAQAPYPVDHRHPGTNRTRSPTPHTAETRH